MQAALNQLLKLGMTEKNVSQINKIAQLQNIPVAEAEVIFYIQNGLQSPTAFAEDLEEFIKGNPPPPDAAPLPESIWTGQKNIADKYDLLWQSNCVAYEQYIRQAAERMATA